MSTKDRQVSTSACWFKNIRKIEKNKLNKYRADWGKRFGALVIIWEKNDNKYVHLMPKNTWKRITDSHTKHSNQTGYFSEEMIFGPS
jgi:hypothetical protein